ncbi:shufflon system plasmid conjugative transfer pilus tip adhesin PilV, partial [Serratia sp. PF2-63]|uniref:shufflon system plasmid conjugative transfer pilus tip adhesin PilV n=1 Tax=Serratia sp. PF2-63 TaxID=3043299 RepID=UPI0024B5D745
TQSIQSNGTINANGNITSSNSIAASGNVTANGSMTANGNITAGNDVTANGTLRASHDAIIGGIIKLQQVNTAGTSCDTWGSVSRDSAGAILSCQSGVWKKAEGGSTRVCANSCGGNWPLEVGRVNHDGDWSSWNTLGQACSGGYTQNWQVPVFCAAN